MIKRFQTSHPASALDHATRWCLAPPDAAHLARVEQATMAAMMTGCSAADARGAVIRCLRGHAVTLDHFGACCRRHIVAMLDAIRGAAEADLDAELLASVCTDAMELGQLLREAYAQGFEAGRGCRSTDILH